MAQAKVLDGSALLVKVGDGGSPTEIFAHPCLINTTRGIEFTAQTNQQGIPDCDDPLAVNWDSTRKVSKGATIQGAGVLHTPNTEEWFAWFNSEDPKNCRVELSGVTFANGGGYWAGAFQLTALSITGNKGSNVEVSVTLVADGEVTWTDAS